MTALVGLTTYGLVASHLLQAVRVQVVFCSRCVEWIDDTLLSRTVHLHHITKKMRMRTPIILSTEDKKIRAREARAERGLLGNAHPRM